EIITEETQGLTGLEIFPNPSDGEQFNLKLQGLENKEVLVVVRDLKGAEYYAKVIVVKSDNQIEVIDPEKHLAPGIYLVTGSSENILYSKKLIVK
ncbi:MAG: T9SS C-terminal target domain-containing protein, partial [Bacteroidetes bacterium]